MCGNMLSSNRTVYKVLEEAFLADHKHILEGLELPHINMHALVFNSAAKNDYINEVTEAVSNRIDAWFEKFGFKYGDIFYFDKTYYILAQVDVKKVCLINLNNGNRMNNPLPIKKAGVVTIEELREISCHANNDFLNKAYRVHVEINIHTNVLTAEEDD